ncbi:uroporphyrinogen decarboxylase [Peptococcaceae bacterium CEB3]|nr:uroporphyrinogen decarboxylase [Peptococcaceae bacterium CEB3]
MSSLTSLERIRRAVDLGQSDCIPVAPYMGNHGAAVAGVSIDKYCQSSELMAEAQYKAWQIYQQDAVVAQSDNYYIAEGFGITVEHHPNGTPTLKTPVVNELKDIDRLKVPNPYTDGRMPIYLEAIKRLAKLVGERVVVRAPGTGPLSLASHLMGTNQFLIELATASMEPGGEAEKYLLKLMDLTTEALFSFAKACLESGAQMVQAGDSLASGDVISPDTYKKFA